MGRLAAFSVRLRERDRLYTDRRNMFRMWAGDPAVGGTAGKKTQKPKTGSLKDREKDFIGSGGLWPFVVHQGSGC